MKASRKKILEEMSGKQCQKLLRSKKFKQIRSKEYLIEFPKTISFGELG